MRIIRRRATNRSSRGRKDERRTGIENHKYKTTTRRLHCAELSPSVAHLSCILLRGNPIVSGHVLDGAIIGPLGQCVWLVCHHRANTGILSEIFIKCVSPIHRSIDRSSHTGEKNESLVDAIDRWMVVQTFRLAPQRSYRALYSDHGRRPKPT